MRFREWSVWGSLGLVALLLTIGLSFVISPREPIQPIVPTNDLSAIQPLTDCRVLLKDTQDTITSIADECMGSFHMPPGNIRILNNIVYPTMRHSLYIQSGMSTPDGSYAVEIPIRDRWIQLDHRHTGMVIIKDHQGKTVEVLHLEDEDVFTPAYETQQMHETYTYQLVK